MSVIEKCASRLINRHLNINDDLTIIHDENYSLLAQTIERLVSKTAVHRIKINNNSCNDGIITQCKDINAQTIILVEPTTFTAHQIYNWLDFSYGAPVISSLNNKSQICVFPLESALRIYTSDEEKDRTAKQSIQSCMNNDRCYRITNKNGTELNFTSRNWIDSGDEILTAPIEDSINGVISVDAALFFQKIDAVIYFYIENGKLTRIEPSNTSGIQLIRSYNQMTAHDFESERNKQLAEIGIGCNTGAIVSDCFMEAEMAWGTCHFCFGNNKCYGGRNASDFHGASILINEPVFTLIQ